MYIWRQNLINVNAVFILLMTFCFLLLLTFRCLIQNAGRVLPLPLTVATIVCLAFLSDTTTPTSVDPFSAYLYGEMSSLDTPSLSITNIFEAGIRNF